MDTCFRTTSTQFYSHHIVQTIVLKLLCWRLWMTSCLVWTQNLVLLYLSAAFDTVNHEILINRLQNKVALQETVLNWSYLCNRSQRISISGTLSRCFNLYCGVPQGSCLGPLLFQAFCYLLISVVRLHRKTPTMCPLLCRRHSTIFILQTWWPSQPRCCNEGHGKVYCRYSKLDDQRWTPTKWWQDRGAINWNSVSAK